MNKKAVILPFVTLIIAIMLFAMGPSLIKLMVTMGGQFGLQYPEAVSFCNVLFVGNACAALVTGTLFGYWKIFKALWQLPWKIKGYLLIASCLLVIYPSLVFIGLEYTSVVNLVIISRFGSIIYVILGFFIYGTRIHWQEATGYVVIGISVIVLLFINNQGFSVSKGDVIILSSTLFFAFTDIVSAKILPYCSDKAYTFCRNFISAIIFFFIVIIFFEPGHFKDAFKGELWILMLVYAAIAIALAQMLWLFALKRLPIPMISNIKLFDPIFAFSFAYLLLREIPTVSQLIIISVITVSIAIPKIVLWRKAKTSTMMSSSMDNGLVGQ